MKLARIIHFRCNEQEYGCDSYVWVADDMTDDELRGLVRKAQQSYLAAEAAFKDAAPIDNPGYSPSYAKHPDLTVAQVQEMHNRSVTAWKEYEATRKAARSPFTEHLVESSAGRIVGFSDADEEFTIEVDANWGHSHGTTIDYGTTQIQDFGQPKDEEQG